MLIQKVAAKFCVCPETAARWLKMSRATMRPTRSTGIPKDPLDAALGLRKQGRGSKRIGTFYGCSHTAARNAIFRLDASGRAAE